MCQSASRWAVLPLRRQLSSAETPRRLGGATLASAALPCSSRKFVKSNASRFLARTPSQRVLQRRVKEMVRGRRLAVPVLRPSVSGSLEFRVSFDLVVSLTEFHAALRAACHSSTSQRFRRDDKGGTNSVPTIPYTYAAEPHLSSPLPRYVTSHARVTSQDPLFFNRTKEMAYLSQHLSSRVDSMTVLVGPVSTGKTGL